MKHAMLVSAVSLVAIASVLAACGGSQSRPQPLPKEPVSTTTVTRSTLTTDIPSAPVAEAPQAPVRDEEKAAPNVPATGETTADRRLSEKVRQHLARKPELSGVGWNRIQIVTVDGNVTLVGELPTTADAIDVEHAVREVKGVRGVTNDIHLPGETPAPRP
jgi:hypothetical protein